MLFSVSGTMARDQEGRISTAKTASLQKIMESRIRDQQEHDEHMQKKMRQSSPRRNQKIERKPPDFVQYGSSKNRRFKEEDAGRRREPHLKQPASTWSRSHQTSRNFKSDDHSSYNQTMAKPKIYVFTGEGDYLEWERTVTKWLCYNRILMKDALDYVMSQLKGNVYKWLLQEEDDRRYYKEPAIITWEDLMLLLRKKYASKGHTSLKSPMKEVTSSKTVTYYIKEKTVKHSWFSEKDKE